MIAFWLYTMSFALTNRARGWGGLLGNEPPAWLGWVQRHIFSRVVLGAWLGYCTCFLALHFRLDANFTLLFFGMWGGWFLGVWLGWGDYFDFERYTNNEIAWIDALVRKMRVRMQRGFTGWLGRRNAKILHLSNSPQFLDAVSMGLRGSYYLPGLCLIGLATHSAWFVLPALFFWQDGAVYLLAKKIIIKGDYIMGAELVSGFVRGALIFAAFALAA